MNNQKKLEWQEVQEIATTDEARSYEGKNWLKKEVYKAANYIRTEFVCSGSLNIKCDAKLKALYIQNLNKTILYRANDHHSLCKSQYEIKPSIKDEIFKIYDSGRTKPSFIEKELRKRNIDITTHKISQIIYNRHAKYKNPTIKDLLNVCNEILLKDEMLIHHELSAGTTKIIISNKNLLLKSKAFKNFHLDGTYKLIDLGYPVLVFGASDNLGSFHLMAIAICDNESADSYIWCVKSLIQFYNVLNLDFNPENVIGDAAPQITVMQETLFPRALRTICWAHVWRNMSKNINLLPRNYRDEFSNDIKFLQLSACQDQFDTGINLFELKWTNFELLTPIITEFKKNYLTGKNSHWFEGYYIFGPSTNNSLERFNRTIKEKYVGWKRNGILNFLKIASEIINDQTSIKKNCSGSSFTEIEYCSTSFTNTIGFELLPLQSTSLCDKFIIINSDKSAISDFELKNNLNLIKMNKFTNFRDFKNIISKYPILSAKPALTSYIDVTCTCWSFMKQKGCSHIYKYLSDRNRLDVISVTLLKTKIKRGRPKKISKNHSLSRE